MRETRNWSLTLLGDVRLHRPDGEELRVGRKTQALLAYLACQRGRTARRDVLARLLWPNVAEASAKASLRQALATVRRGQSDAAPLLLSDDVSVRLTDDVAVDVARFEAMAAGSAEDRQTAADLYHAGLMDGFTLPDAEAFNEWLAIEQTRLRQIAVRLFDGLIEEAGREGGSVDEGVRAALRLLALEPYNEAAHRGLMSLYVRQGRSAQALHHYRDLRRSLRETLQVDPEGATVALARSLRLDRNRTDDESRPLTPSPVSAVDKTDASEPARPPVGVATGRRRWAAVGVAVLGLAAFGGGLLALSAGRSRPVVGIENVQPLVEGDVFAIRGVLSPDGQHVAYVVRDRASPEGHLYVANADKEGEPVRFTTDKAIVNFPAWSPDGKAIAFVRHRSGQPCEILIKPFPLGEETPVADCLSSVINGLEFGVDGKALYIADGSTDEVQDRIHRIDLKSRETRPVTSPPAGTLGDMAPRLSRDGRHLAFLRRIGTFATELVIRDLRSGRERVVVPADQVIWSVMWGPGDDDLIYSAGVGGESALWHIDSRGRGPASKLAPGLMQYTLVAGAAKTDRMVFEVMKTSRTLMYAPRVFGAKAAVVVDSQREMSRAFAERPGGDRAVVLRRGGGERIWLLPAVGGPRVLTEPGRIYGHLSWSADGRLLAYICGDGVRSDVCILDIASGVERRVTHDGSQKWAPAWSGDGVHIYFGAVRGAGEWRIWRIDAAGREPAVPVTPSGIRSARPVGDFLYYARMGRAGLWRRRLTASPDSNVETPILSALSVADESNWFIEGPHVVYLRRTNGATDGEVRRHTLATGRETVLLNVSDVSPSHALAPAGRDGLLILTERQSANVMRAELRRR